MRVEKMGEEKGKWQKIICTKMHWCDVVLDLNDWAMSILAHKLTAMWSAHNPWITDDTNTCKLQWSWMVSRHVFISSSSNHAGKPRWDNASVFKPSLVAVKKIDHLCWIFRKIETFSLIPLSMSNKLLAFFPTDPLFQASNQLAIVQTGVVLCTSYSNQRYSKIVTKMEMVRYPMMNLKKWWKRLERNLPI